MFFIRNRARGQAQDAATEGCSTLCPPRHSVVVQPCSAWAEQQAEEDLSVFPGKENPGSHRQPLQSDGWRNQNESPKPISCWYQDGKMTM